LSRSIDFVIILPKHVGGLQVVLSDVEVVADPPFLPPPIRSTFATRAPFAGWSPEKSPSPGSGA